MSFPEMPNQVNPETERRVMVEAQAAKDAQNKADDLKAKADNASAEAERDKLLLESQEQEDEAKAHSKEARQIASGAWQGTVGGIGVGTGVGTGAGAVVGTLVGTIASIPMAGLGALIGLPIGLIHGPFVQTGQSGVGKKEGPSEDEQHRATIQALDIAKERGERKVDELNEERS